MTFLTELLKLNFFETRARLWDLLVILVDSLAPAPGYCICRDIVFNVWLTLARQSAVTLEPAMDMQALGMFQDIQDWPLLPIAAPECCHWLINLT